MTALVVLALAVLLAATTWATGWWAVLVVALATGVLWRHAHAARYCALAATLGWGLLLAADARGGRLLVVGRVTGGVLRMPAAALLVVTLLFAAAGAWSAAAIGAEVTRIARMRRGRPDQSR